MKIALLHYSAPPVTGGVERVVAEQIRLLRKEGHTVVLACFEGGQNEAADSHIPLSRNASCDDLVTYLGNALAGMDCVLMHNVGTMPFAPALTAALKILAERQTDCRWICWVHDMALGNPDYPEVGPGPNHPYAEACPHWEYVGVSALRVREVQDWLRVPCQLIPNGIDPAFTLQISPKVALLAEQLGLWDADAVLLNPTRLLPRKVVESGIKMTRAIRSLGLQLQYLITGAEDPHNPTHAVYAKHLKVLTETLNLTDSVHFLGDSLDIGPRELADAYQISDAIFLSSAREGFGLPVLEAGAFGKTVFCPDGEPLSSLPGAVTYSRDLGIPELSSWMIQQLRMRETITARRNIFKNFRWPSVYKNHLAPLLQRPPNRAS